MFRPEEMVKLEVITLNRYKDTLLTYLHEAGAVEVREVKVELAQKDTPNEYHRKAASYSISMSRLVEFLGTYRKAAGGGIKEFFFPKEKPKRTYRYERLEKLIKDVEEFLGKVEPEIKAIEGRMNSLSTEIERIKEQIGILDILTPLNIDVSYLRHCGVVEVTVGLVDRTRVKELADALKKETENHVAIITKEASDKALVVIVNLARDHDKVNTLLAKFSVEKLEIPEGEGTPKELMKEYSKKLAEKEKELEEAKKEASKLAEKYYDDVLFYKELVDNERDKSTVLPMLARTNMTFALTGWVPRPDVQKILEGIKRITEGKAYINVREPRKEELEEMPVKLKNPGWARPFEMLTEMYGVPRHDEIDPTPIIAFTYSFFFGFMLTDFLYGLIVGIVAALLVKGHKKFNDGTYKFAYILLWSAFFTMLLGALFGSYFGNAADIMLQYITGDQNAHAWRLLDPLREPMPMLLAALAIGLAHLFLGYTLGFVIKWKNGDRKGAVFEQLPWMIIIIGVALLASQREGLDAAAKAILGTGIALFAVGELVINGGLAALMIISDFFGFVGNWLSYARLMALALATGGIAMVINVLVGMVWAIKFLYIGPIIGLIIFFGGQLFSTAINALGAFVHALRLHYVEFFGTFYSGEGKRFEPFKSKREVSKLELEV
ncbi:archaeal/vacuolar-type H+-ATPase, subunit I [Thermococcus kodakarensis KOD1]|uniref:A-type ATP synthase subunit I n=1 Tax=Thermococcus kodakarensis (strain ATCC BAA-918 / JCM 12380 / KOD1) TaxID=69014 RepID=AATI_THEKO|nr:V-type ATP synthase subunit I [Thermococcus kodakarensis]Q5JDS2.1 RecName: Full=V-type ATP synthase subunit I; AltName: Full=V-ATPase subunit I [Thermococcus kodakarensis KOD1]WCN27537.1 V-type ATP synthase subunit I [Thermococcus kodakarensis]WCN29828.1 V-type ATP synthase subunit I [Thermococcus kodakarensis]BAD85786.1 archaeal/vacuolar-type H+-ATPase, subunit I [Thermococcus kodakarensis KOD1]